MSTSRLIEKRFLWAGVLTLIIVGISVYLRAKGNDLGNSPLWRPLAIIALTYGGGFYSFLSLVNVAYCLVSRGGIHDDVIGFLGGLIFAFGAISLTFVSMGEVQITMLGLVAVILVIGLTMMVKG
jgi:hypothetical protein